MVRRWQIGTLATVKFDNIYEELNGQEEASFFLPNTPENRYYVTYDNTLDIKFDGGTLFTGYFSAVDYERNRLTYRGYNETYERMRKHAVSGIYTGEGSLILNDACSAGGVAMGQCPAGTVTVQLDNAYCYDVGQFLSEVYNADFWAEGGTFNIGVRDSCVCCLPFEEGTGTACLDASGYGNDGVLSDGAREVGNMIWFNGTRSISIPYNVNMIPENLTVECWVAPKGSGTAQKYIVARSHGYAIDQIYGTQLNFYVYDGAAYQPTTTTIGTTDWTHIACTTTNGTQRVLINGVYAASTGNPYLPDAGSICTVGAWLGTVNKCWIGTLDTLLFWNRQLTDNEIKLHYTDSFYDSKFTQIDRRSIDRSKARDKIVYRGKDSGGTVIYGEAGVGNDIAVFHEYRATDIPTLSALAENKLAELNNDNSAVVLTIPIHMAVHLKPGDIIPVYNSVYALDGSFRIQKITKYSTYAKVEVDRKIETMENKLLNLSRYEELGISTTLTLTASDNLRWSNDAYKSTHDTVYHKIKEIKVNQAITGSIRIRFSVAISGFATETVRIYLNDGAIGTEHTTTTSDTWDQDFSDTWTPGDLIQIYAKTSLAADAASAYNLRILYDPAVYISFWNQDP